jgi:diaminopimelate decarboxylase
MAFLYRDRKLVIGSKSASGAAVTVESLLPKPWRKPTYIYDLDDVDLRYQAMNRALSGVKHTIHYAMKANSNPLMLRFLARLGAGVDTVSAGEIARALEAKVPANKIIFSGVAKTKAEIDFALRSGIKQINVESIGELERIASIAQTLDLQADVAFRINPDVNPETHPYITTGFRENKFGMDDSFLPQLFTILQREHHWLKPRGLTMHIGSLLFDLAVFREAIDKTIAIHRRFQESGFSLDRLDIGGGLGIKYETDDTKDEFAMIEAYGQMAKSALTSLGGDVELLTEPGRILVGRSGLLVTEVQYIKSTTARCFAIVDSGMHHLLRPALYGATHRVLPLSQSSTSPWIKYDVVGPICESSDFLAKDVSLGELYQGSLLGMADAGAYGFAMASCYNSHELPDEIFVCDGRKIS